MNFIEFRKALNAFPVFSYSDIRKVVPEFDRRRLVDLINTKDIKKVLLFEEYLKQVRL